MTRVIMAAIPFPGHVNPLRPIAAHLVAEGHDVTFVTGTNLRDAVLSTGAAFHPLQGQADYDGPEVYQSVPELTRVAPGVEQIAVYLTEVLAKPMREQHEAVQEVLAQQPDTPTIVLHEMYFNGLWPIQLGAPGIRPAEVIGLGVTVLPVYSADTPPFGLGLLPDASPAGRERNARLNAEVRAAYAPAQRLAEQLVRDCGGTGTLPSYFDAQVVVADRFLHLSIPSMEYPRSDLPASVRFVGVPWEADHQDVPLPDWWNEVLEAGQVVLVSQGTVSNADFSELVLPTIEALAGQDCLVVATTGGRPVSDLGVLPANVRAAEYIPYTRLLPHVDVFISNGGFGGMQMALSRGVPLVLAGETEEKKDSTAHAAWTGAAVNLATSRPSAAAVGRAVHAVLHDDSYRLAARRLQAEYAEYDALRSITDIVEAAAEPSVVAR
ncbi:glycosyltransferase [Amycolatopsis sp. Hca4]|uniref:glycosyltransferase n=1 Tax=Amycolatopsis sp. Hca4 TaxID=2742131 RepID=UPI00159034E7|nr:nucleotide disphospho-sugar-binding domain-containing protein [Amycolatopsis sp. Hca4]QKV74040.1 glycosyltransferase [Amycolatopsis sp. Hca4]